jgi:tetratricopeptide (TPR) repeat protein
MNKNGHPVETGSLPAAKASSSERPSLLRDPKAHQTAKSLKTPQTGYACTGTRILVVIVMIVVLASATFLRNRVWQNSLLLWKDAVAKSPAKARPHYQLGYYYDRKERMNEAMQEYQAALRLGPDYLVAEWAHNNLGNIYGKQGRYDEAISEFKATLAIHPSDSVAHTNLGIIYAKQAAYTRHCANSRPPFKAIPMTPQHITLSGTPTRSRDV